MVEGTLIGAYRVLKEIGKGGMGSVWLVEHIALGRRAALKVLHPEFSTRPDIVARFFNEARAATAIANPGIVQIFDFGHHIDGRAYIVMELLDGEPLDRRLRREGALGLVEGLGLMRQVASTLGAAHARGVVHRDLKPENIYVVRDFEVPGGERTKVLDFGIAKLVDKQAGLKTHTSTMMGTPMFMSPEQCRGAGQVDQRSDVYSLGCVLFTVLVGRPPFHADGVGDIIAMHLREPAPAPSQLLPGIPPEVDQLVLRCLAKDPAQRFPTAGELAAAIGELLRSPLQVPAARTMSYFAAAQPTTLSAATGEGSTPGANRSRRKVSAVVVGFGAGVAIAIIATRGGEQPAPTPAPAVVPAAVQDRPPTPARALPPVFTPAAVPAPPPPPLVATATGSSPPAPGVRLEPIMKGAVQRFVAWSRDHAGAPCPDAAALGVPDDPWGHPLAITCTDQPSDQIAGVISAGPDGKPGTTDDIASWQLGREVVDLVRGARWLAEPRGLAVKPAVPGKPQPPAPAPTRPKRAQPAAPAVRLDANGMPITR